MAHWMSALRLPETDPARENGLESWDRAQYRSSTRAVDLAQPIGAAGRVSQVADDAEEEYEQDEGDEVGEEERVAVGLAADFLAEDARDEVDKDEGEVSEDLVNFELPRTRSSKRLTLNGGRSTRSICC